MTTSRGKFLQLEKSLELSPFLKPAKVVLRGNNCPMAEVSILIVEKNRDRLA